MSRPVATLALAAGVLCGYGFELSGGGYKVCRARGFIPAHPSFEGAFGSLFLHDPGSFLHLGGNLIFLLAFGVVVERALGSIALLSLFAGAGLAGCGIHYIVTPGATESLVGCSGSVFGLIAVASVIQPRLLGFALAFGLVSVWHILFGGGGNASAACHVGGFLLGVIAAGAMRVFGGFDAEEERLA